MANPNPITIQIDTLLEALKDTAWTLADLNTEGSTILAKATLPGAGLTLAEKQFLVDTLFRLVRRLGWRLVAADLSPTDPVVFLAADKEIELPPHDQRGEPKEFTRASFEALKQAAREVFGGYVRKPYATFRR